MWNKMSFPLFADQNALVFIFPLRSTKKRCETVKSGVLNCSWNSHLRWCTSEKMTENPMTTFKSSFESPFRSQVNYLVLCMHVHGKQVCYLLFFSCIYRRIRGWGARADARDLYLFLFKEWLGLVPRLCFFRQKKVHLRIRMSFPRLELFGLLKG